MRKWQKFSKEELDSIVKNSYSYAQVAHQMGYKRSGGSGITAAKEMIDYYNFNIDHFTGQGWNKGNFDYSRFVYGKAMKARNMFDALVNLRGRKCERCGNSHWLGQEITLEVHHKDGDSLNNKLNNLELLCPNCHALTNNWRGKNIKKKMIRIPEDEFVEALRSSPNIRQALIKLDASPKGGNYKKANELIIKYNIEHLL